MTRGDADHGLLRSGLRFVAVFCAGMPTWAVARGRNEFPIVHGFKLPVGAARGVTPRTDLVHSHAFSIADPSPFSVPTLPSPLSGTAPARRVDCLQWRACFAELWPPLDGPGRSPAERVGPAGASAGPWPPGHSSRTPTCPPATASSCPSPSARMRRRPRNGAPDGAGPVGFGRRGRTPTTLSDAGLSALAGGAGARAGGEGGGGGSGVRRLAFSYPPPPTTSPQPPAPPAVALATRGGRCCLQARGRRLRGGGKGGARGERGGGA